MTEFDEITVQRGLVRVLTPLLDSFLARMKFKASNGVWVEDSSQPAIYLGFPNEIEPSNPKVFITYNGDTDTTSSSYESGLEDIEDPNDPPNIITVPFERSYITYILTLTADSGPKDKVNRGEVLSASSILRKVRDNLMLSSFRETIHTEMNSTIKMINPITPIYDLEQTSFQDAAVMRLIFDATSTIHDLGGSFIQTINYESCYKRTLDDPNPIISTGSVTSILTANLSATELPDVVNFDITVV